VYNVRGEEGLGWSSVLTHDTISMKENWKTDVVALSDLDGKFETHNG